jgi:hypothetical protein
MHFILQGLVAVFIWVICIMVINRSYPTSRRSTALLMAAPTTLLTIFILNFLGLVLACVVLAALGLDTIGRTILNYTPNLSKQFDRTVLKVVQKINKIGEPIYLWVKDLGIK